jgi:pilus assembly protein FimV
MAFAEDLDWDMPAPSTPSPVAEPARAEEPAIESIAASEPPSWSEPESLDFEPASMFDEVSEPVETAESVPVLDLSGIDLDLEEEPPVAIQAAPVIEMPTPAMPAATEPADEALAFADEFTPDLAEDFKPVSAPEAKPADAPVSAEAAPTSAESADSELWEEVNTKLDLARAYLEMGDKEGAREILQEVLGEGDPQQKADADKLLADAG